MLLGMKNYESDCYADAWNFGPGLTGTFTVQEVVEEFFRLYGKGSWELEGKNDFHEAQLLSLDITKSYRLLGWKPVLNFEDTIRLTSAWYLNYKNVPSVLELCRQQINYFENYVR